MVYETKEILITVKAYPSISKKYTETVCVAGIDINSKNWIRLYPVPFRDLTDEKKFKKYNIIGADVLKSKKDSRPESYKVNIDSIEILDFLDSRRDKWSKRKEIIFPTLSNSFCEILKEREINNKSLGIFKPTNVSFEYEKSYKKNSDNTDYLYSQLSFFNKEKKKIDSIPYIFRYKFYCKNLNNCPGHTLSIIDWEIGQAYRSWRHKYKYENLLLEKIKERFLLNICSESNDYYFYVGNMHRFQSIFMILGIFYPPK